MDDEGELSMGMQGANNYEDDIVSDDGHIWVSPQNDFIFPRAFLIYLSISTQ